MVQKHFVVWMERHLAHLEQDAARWDAEGQAHNAYLARFYLEWGRGILESFIGRYSRNLTAALRELCANGTAEPLAGAATHAYLPLLGRAESLRAQLDVGALAVTRLLGVRPRGLWLPECGYTPALEALLRPSGARYLIVDPSSLPANSHPAPAPALDRLAAAGRAGARHTGIPADAGARSRLCRRPALPLGAA